ncbi:hypothetical protein HYH03_014958 [Edaphochlamys debaryana]|uniref:VOC domain-containing protein n=1 Tax=Edaphochlamys debaryana TaxID=47281 RepID=A0A835XLQ8_9CHLO|nr:hypothetical protein HYH03_014958 [Edaphochlamys debaryana]|eukprot:KAG2486378.1 hypothetical protein HYH03_014958 [Edaphochlamys debaryana]
MDHVGLRVKDYEASKAFYIKALGPLGLRIVKEIPGFKACGFGCQFPFFWICEGPVSDNPPAHVAFYASTRDKVHAFHAAALAAGAKDNGAPGFRRHYHPMYYGAFVYDPDGYNIEAVKHWPEGLAEWLAMAWGLLKRTLGLGGAGGASGASATGCPAAGSAEHAKAH